MKGKSLPWEMDNATQMQGGRKQLEHPGIRGLVIIACVPELSPLKRLYLQRLEETGTAPVEIRVNTQEEEAGSSNH